MVQVVSQWQANRQNLTSATPKVYCQWGSREREGGVFVGRDQ